MKQSKYGRRVHVIDVDGTYLGSIGSEDTVVRTNEGEMKESRYGEQPPDHYDRRYAWEIEQSSTARCAWWDQPLHRMVWYPALCMAKPPILDLGCGLGHLAGMTREVGIPYAEGIDVSPHAIAYARNRYRHARFTIGDVRHLIMRYERRDYRTVMLLEVLEHFHHDLAILWPIPRGTWVVASVPSFLGFGHARAFDHRDEVRARYSDLVSIRHLVVENAINGDNRWFVFAGRRR